MEETDSHQSIFGKTDRAKALPDNYRYLLLLLFHNRLKRIPFALKQIQTNTDGNSLSYYIDRAKALPDQYGFLLSLLFQNRYKRIPFALERIQMDTDGYSLS